MGHPYRDGQQPTSLEKPREIRINTCDISDVTVEITWQSRVGDIKVTRITFEGDENTYEEPVEVNGRYGSPPRLHGGHEKFDNFMERGYKRGYSNVDGEGTYVPWHRIFSFRIVETNKKEVKIRWYFAERKDT